MNHSLRSSRVVTSVAGWACCALLLGLGAGTARAQTATLTPAGPMTFAAQDYNTTSGVQSLTLENTGGADLTITSIGTTGGDAADFNVSHNCPLSPVTLATGNSCDIDVTFTPGDAGARSTTLQVSSDGGNPSVTLEGIGNPVPFAPAIAVAGTYTLEVVGGDLRLSDGVNTFTQLQSATSEITITGSAGDDVLIVDFSGTNPIPAGGLSFDAGTGTNGLELEGGTFDSATYTATNSTDGTIALVDGGDTFNVTYLNLSPIDDTNTVTDLIFNATADPDQIEVQESPTLAGGSQIVSNNGTFELLNFTNKTNVTINALGEDDTVTLSATAAATGLASLTINGGAGEDGFLIQATVSGVSYALNGDGDSNGFAFGNASNSLDDVAAPVAIDAGSGPNNSLDVNDQGDAAGHTYELTGAAVTRDGITHALTGTFAFVGIMSGDGDDTYTIQADELYSGAQHVFTGGLGNDTFALNFANGQSVAAAAGTELILTGGGPDGDAGNRDVVRVNEQNSAGRTAGIAYTTDTRLTLTGFGTAAGIELESFEVFDYNGDAANDDDVTIDGTTDADIFTVQPRDHGADVFRGGTPFASPGLGHDGALSADLELDGLANGTLTIDGNDPSDLSDRDALYYDGSGTIAFSGVDGGTITGTSVVTVAYGEIEDVVVDGTLQEAVGGVTALVTDARVIGAAGGILSGRTGTATDGVSVEVGAGDVAAPTLFRIGTFSVSPPAVTGTTTPAGFGGIRGFSPNQGGPVFYFGPAGTSFADDVDVTIPYDEPTAPFDEQAFKVLRFTESTGLYTLDPTVFTADFANNEVTFGTDTFSGFGFGPDIDLEVELLQPISDDDPYPDAGYDASYQVQVTNHGPNPATDVEITFVDLTGGVAFEPDAGNTFDGTVWSIASLGVGSSATLAFQAQRTADGVHYFEIRATGANEFDNDLANNTSVEGRVTPTDPDFLLTIPSIAPDPINVDDEATVTVQIENVRKDAPDVLEVTVTLDDVLQLVAGSGTIACTGDDACTFTKVHDTKGLFTYSGDEFVEGSVITLQFDVKGLDEKDDASVRVDVTKHEPDEDPTSEEQNFALASLDVIAPDLDVDLAAFLDPSGASTAINPGDLLASGSRVQVEVTLTNQATGATADDADAGTIVLVSVPGLSVDLATAFTSGGTQACTFGATCSFDPTSGIWSINLALADDAPGPAGSTQLVFEGTVNDAAFAGAWSARVTSQSPPDADETNNEATLGITINRAPGWETLEGGPFDGTVTSVYVTEGSIKVFAATDGEGIFFSDDAGANWCHDYDDPATVADERLPRRYVRGVVQTSSRLVAATYKGNGIYYSTDGGRTWTAGGTPVDGVTGADPNIRTLRYFEDGAEENLLVGTNANVFRSIDHGDSWTEATGLPGTNLIYTSLAVNADASVVLATTSTGLVYRSANKGVSFVQASSDLSGTPVFALAFDDGTFYAATSQGVYASTDDGTSWNARSLGGGVTAPVLRSITAYTKSGTHYVVAGGDGGQIWTSADGGASWTYAGIGMHNLTVLSLVDYEDPATGDVYLYAGGGAGGLFRSTDHGLSWHQARIGTTPIQVYTLAFGTDGNLLAGTWGYGVYRNDPSCGWIPLGGQPGSDGTGTDGLLSPWIFSLAVSPASGSYFAGTAAAGAFRSDDNGASWVQTVAPNLNVHDVGVFTAASSDEMILAGTDQGTIFRSLDDGFSWHSLAAARGAAVWAVHGMTDGADDVYLAGTFGQGILRSENGDDWAQTGLATGYVYDFTEDNLGGSPTQGDLFAASATGIYRSADDGLTWAKLDDPAVEGKDIRALVFVDDGRNDNGGSANGVLYAALWGGGLVISDPDRSGVANTLELGEEGTWFTQSDLTDELPGDIEIRVFASRVVAGTGDDGVEANYQELYAVTKEGQVYRYRRFVASNGTTTDVEETPADGAELPASYALMQNYPNPFNPVTTITFELPEQSVVRIAVYDVLGREVRVLADGAYAAGRHEVTFEAGDLVSGVYLYRLETPGHVIARRMVLMK